MYAQEISEYLISNKMEEKLCLQLYLPTQLIT